MRRTALENGLVLSMDDQIGTLDRGTVVIAGDRIEAVGGEPDVAGADVVDASGCIVMPGLIDGHRHMFSALLRGCAADASYEQYFQDVVMTYGAAYAPSDTGAAVALGASEALDSGITTIHAWEHNLHTPDHADAAIEALIRSGLRGRFSYGPPNEPSVVDRSDVERQLAGRFGRELDGLHSTSDGRLHLGLATRGFEFHDRDLWTGEFAFAREHGLPVTAHMSQAGMVADCAAQGALGPDLLVIHARRTTPEERKALADTGTPVCIASPAIARAGLGRSPVRDLADAGIRLCLSVDSIAGCDSSDMFAVMRIAVLIERVHHEDVLAYTPEQALRHATIDAANALGLGAVTGSLTPGKRADVIMVRADALNMAPLNVPASQLVLAGQPRNVDTVIVDGEVRKRDGVLVGVDVARQVEDATAAVRGIAARIGRPVV